LFGAWEIDANNLASTKQAVKIKPKQAVVVIIFDHLSVV